MFFILILIMSENRNLNENAPMNVISVELSGMCYDSWLNKKLKVIYTDTLI